MIKNNKKSLILITLSLIFIFGFFPFEKAKAGTTDNVSGWGWSENIGWISFNCTNQASCSKIDYGVNIDLTGTGLITGYAWSENIGWISFNSSSLTGCPSGNCEAKFSPSTNELSGWARACSVFQSGCSGDVAGNLGNWEGWIHLKGSNYSTTFNSVTNELSGYAWGGDVIGWVSFNCNNTATACDVSQYKVIVTVPKPSADNLTVADDNSLFYCPNPTHPPVLLSWNFLGANGSTQTGYQIQISTDSGFSNIVEDTNQVSNTGSSYTAANLNYGSVTYYWRLMVWDNKGGQSNWITGPSFTTIAYPYPTPSFTWSPQKITVGKPVGFLGSVNKWEDPGVPDWRWDVDNNGAFEYFTQNATHTYTVVNIGGNPVKLEVTVSGKTCPVTQSISVLFSPPIWIETRPPSK